MTYDDIMNLATKVLEREGMLLSKDDMEGLQQDASAISARYEKVSKEEMCPVKEFHVIDERADRVDYGSRIDGYSITDDNDIFLIKAEKEFPVFFLKRMNRKEWPFYENIGPNTIEGDAQNFYMIFEISHYTDNHVILNMTKSQVNKIRQATVFLYNPMYESIMAKVRDVIHFTNHNFKSLSGKDLNLEQDMQYFYAWYKFIECNDDQADAIKDICEYLDKISSRNTIMGYLVYEKY